MTDQGTDSVSGGVDVLDGGFYSLTGDLAGHLVAEAGGTASISASATSISATGGSVNVGTITGDADASAGGSISATTIMGGASAESAGAVTANSISGGIEVDRAGSKVTASGSFTGDGISVSDGATASIGSGPITLTAVDGYDGVVSIDDAGSTLDYSGTFDFVDGELDLSDGASYTTGGGLTLGDVSGDQGRVDIDNASGDGGPDGTFTIAGPLVIGNAGQGEFEQDSGQTVVQNDVTIGTAASGSGRLNSFGGTVTVSGDMTVGDGGAAAVEVSAGGIVDVKGTVDVGTVAPPKPASLTFIVNGAGSDFEAGNLAVGSETSIADTYGDWQYSDSIPGTIEVENGGELTVDHTLTLTQQGFVDADATSAVEVGGSHAIGSAGGAEADQLLVDAGGRIVTSGPLPIPSGGTVVDNGTIEIQNGNSSIGAVTGTGTLQIDDQSSLEATGAVGPNVTVEFNGGYQTTLQLDDPKDFEGTISGLAQGDTIVLPETSINALGYGVISHTEVSNDTLTITFKSGNTLSYALNDVPSGSVFDTHTDNQGSDYKLTLEPESPRLITGSNGGNPIPGKPTGNPYIDSLITGWAAWAPGSTISYCFGDPTDVATAVGTHATTSAVPYNSAPSPLDTWTAAQEAAFVSALQSSSAVTNLTFAPATSAASANLTFWQNPQLPKYLNETPDVTAQSETVADDPSGRLWLTFNDSFWKNDPNTLSPGGRGYKTALHEIGHALGLSHPQDGGDEPDATTFPGVTSTNTYGTNSQNQSVFTVMSYNNGWTGQPTTTTDLGVNLTPAAFDIAALQDLYGTNPNTNSGDNTYQLPAQNVVGTGWTCIWDTGGNDTISNAGSSYGAIIDLRPAPLSGQNAGGYTSYVKGIQGGFTIANGVTIENAVGGNGNDTLIGSSGDETFEGNGGNDRIIGGSGDNTAIYSGNAADYTISVSDGDLIVTDKRAGSPDGTDTLQNIQHLQFADQTLPGLSGPTLAIDPIGDNDVLNAAEAAAPLDITGVSSGLVGQPLTLTFNDTSYGTTIGSDGTFDVTIPTSAMTPSVLPDGSYVITASATAVDSTAPTTANETIEVAETPAHVTGVTPSQTAPATTGETVELEVAFSAPVSVASNADEDSPGLSISAPTLSLNDGGTATYDATASSGTSLVFDYTVGVSDQTPDLTVTAFNSNGSTILDDNANVADTSGADRATGLVVGAGSSAGTPTIAGTHATADTDEAPVAPFTGVMIADPNGGATDALTITLGGAGGTLMGAGLAGGTNGVYTFASAAPATLTAELNALSFTPTAPPPGTSATTTFTLNDASSAGTSATDVGTSVTDTAAAAPTPTPTTTPAPSADTVSIDPDPAFVGHGTFLIGMAASPAGVKSLEISAEVDGVENDLGSATMNGDGTFTFEDKVGPHVQSFITATETDDAGGTASGSPLLSLQAGLGGSSTVAREDHYTADGSAYTSSTLFRRGGSSTVAVDAPGQTVTSNAFDIIDNDHRADMTFVFDPGFGIDVVQGFRAAGADHDVLNLSASDFTSIADVLRNTGDIEGSAFITDPKTGDAIRLAGVTTAELKLHPKDIAFHA